MTWYTPTPQPYAPAPAPPPPPTGPPPNWYPDPSGVGQLRYWNGWAWTPGVVIQGQVTERPLPDPRTLSGRFETDTRIQLPLRAGGLAVAGFAMGLVLGVVLTILADLAGAPVVVEFLLAQAGLWAPLLGSCWLASRKYGTGHLARDFGLKLRPTDVSWGLLMSVIARVAGAIVAIPIVLGLPELLDNEDLDVYERLAGNDLAVAIALAVIATLGAPIVEELFFRGLVQGSLTTGIGPIAAIAVQAVLFGAVHFSPELGMANLVVVTVITVGGVVFGIAARWRGLGTSVMAHTFYNMLATVLLLG